MSIERPNPNTIYLGGGGPGGEEGITYVNDIVAGATITPGMLIETYNDGLVTKWRPHSAAAGVASRAVALEQLMLNKGVDDNYAAGDLVQAGILKAGSMFWGLIPSGEDIANQDFLQSNGDGLMKEATASTAAAGVAHYKAHDNLGAVTANTRCRVEVIF